MTTQTWRIIDAEVTAPAAPNAGCVAWPPRIYNFKSVMDTFQELEDSATHLNAEIVDWLSGPVHILHTLHYHDGLVLFTMQLVSVLAKQVALRIKELGGEWQVSNVYVNIGEKGNEPGGWRTSEHGIILMRQKPAH